MSTNMTAEEALAFAKELRTAAACLKLAHQDDVQKPRGAGLGDEEFYVEALQDWVCLDYSTFEEALASIREAARWYEKVAGLGFGVHAWH